MNEEYFLLRNGEDGISITQFPNVEELIKHIDEYYLKDECYHTFLDKLPKEKYKDEYIRDLHDLTDGCDTSGTVLMVIKGKIIVPKPIKVVHKYDIE